MNRSELDDTPSVLPVVGLGEVLATIRRHLTLIFVSIALCVGLGSYLYVTQATQFNARAVLRLVADRRALTEGISDDVAFDAAAQAGVSPLLTEVEVLSTEAVLGDVVDQLGLRLVSLTPEFPTAWLDDVVVDSAATADSLRVRFGSSEYRVFATDAPVSAQYGEPVSVGGVTFAVAARPTTQTDATEVWLRVIPRRTAIQVLRRQFVAAPRTQTGLIDISVTVDDPTRAVELASAIATTAAAVSARTAQEQSSRRSLFIEEQMRQADSTLAAMQFALSEFRSQRSVYSGAREQLRSEQAALSDLEGRRSRLVTERETGQRLLDQLQSGPDGASRQDLRSLVAAPGIAENPTIQQLHAQLVSYETERTSITSGTFAKAPTHPDVERLTAFIGSTEAALRAAVGSHLTTVGAQIAALGDMLAQNSTELRALPQTEAEEDRLEQRVTNARVLADQLRSELQRARIAETVQVGRVEVLERAGAVFPIQRWQPIHLVLWLALGLIVGGAGSYARETLDTTVHRPEEVEQLLRVPELGVIPPIAELKKKPWWRRSKNGKRPRSTESDGDYRLREHLDPSSREAFRILRTNILHAAGDDGPKTLLVTSADPGEGKSTTAINLAAAFADQGLRVLLMDVDMRKPKLHKLCQVKLDPGLSTYLRGEDPRGLIRRVQTNLHLITAGSLQHIETDSLASTRMQELLTRLGRGFSLIVLDTPPLGVVPDAAILGGIVDGVVLVTRAGRTERDRARESMRQLERVGARVLGAVVNDPESRLRRYGGATYYPYAYASYAADYADSKGDW